MVEGGRQLPDRPQAVLLDCLGTLVRLEPPAGRLRTELAHRRIWVSEEGAAAAFRAEIAHYLEHHLEGFDAASLELLRDDCARVMVDALEVERSATGAVREAMLAALRFRPYPDAAPALRALRAAHMRLVVTSNWDCSLPEMLAEAGLLALVDAVVTSAGTGAAKPDPAPFRAALEAARCEPGDAVHVGDSVEHDVAGARAAGVAPVLLARHAAGPSPEAPPGTPLARSLHEVGSLLLTGR